MEKKKTFLSWVKEHKTELIIIAVTAAGTVLTIKKWDNIKGLFSSEELKKLAKLQRNSTVDSVLPTSEPRKVLVQLVNVREHVRNLPHGYHASQSKILEATERGIELAENQTIISAHPRYYAA